MTTARPDDQPMLLGHPTGLFLLFFAEMWERFSYYGMRALLIFYMTKSFLKYGDTRAYAVYGAYCSLVYAGPFIGGILADRLLGTRRAVILGGMLMAAGHLLMAFEHVYAFYLALALIICGSGFFKPNISTIVGTLYGRGNPRRDGGFTIFYMGINLGAALAPILCGYVGETYGWHYGFGLAAIGMMAGIAVFWAPARVAQILISGCALVTAVGILTLGRDPVMMAVNGAVALALLVSAGVSFVALRRGGLPEWAGAPPDPERLRRPVFAGIRIEWVVYAWVALAVPVLAFLVYNHAAAGWVLIAFGGAAFLSLVYFAFRSEKIDRERLFVVLILMFFSMLFWAFFEQAGSSINNFTDRNIDRVLEERTLTADDVGKTLEIPLTQALLGHTYEGEPFTLTRLTKMREEKTETIRWTVGEGDIGMGVGGTEIRASVFQAVNPIFILSFGLVFTCLWTFLARRKLDPSVPVKFGLGLLQVGLGFGALYLGASRSDSFGMVGVGWLILGYSLHTTGELCLSPVGLAMVTRLSPARVVSTVMGAWFLATAFSGYLAGRIAQLAGISHEEGGEQVIPPPQDTVGVYGELFWKVAIAAMVSAVIVLAISPLLRRWMHPEVVDDAPPDPS
ncbi:MAG: MFS transporter [Planctomycetes bacterium]|nr:MFS transporter [Planctomycetota bacterium]